MVGTPWNSELVTKYANKCSVFQLNPGTLNSSDLDTAAVTLKKGSLFITNCTDASLVMYEEIAEYYRPKLANLDTTVLSELVDPFRGGVTVANYETCAGTAASWMLVLLQLLSLSAKPLLFRLTTLILACIETYLLKNISDEIHRQFIECLQDRRYLATMYVNRDNVNASSYVHQLATCLTVLQCTYLTLRQTRLLQGSKRYWHITGFAVDVVCALLGQIMLGVLHFYADAHTVYSVMYPPSITMVVVNCIHYAYTALVYGYFVSTRIKFACTLENIALIVLCIIFFVVSIVTRMIPVFNQMKSRWLDGLSSLFQLIAVNLVYELLANWEQYEREMEQRGIVGRETDQSNYQPVAFTNRTTTDGASTNRASTNEATIENSNETLPKETTSSETS